MLFGLDLKDIWIFDLFFYTVNFSLQLHLVTKYKTSQREKIQAERKERNNKLASLEATLVETTTHLLTDGGEV